MVDRDQEIEIDKPTGAPKRPEITVIDISIGHSHLAKGAKGMYHGRELREYEFNSKVRVVLEEYARKQQDLKLRFRFWDHRENLKWGMRDGVMQTGKILVDRLKAMYEDKSLSPPVRYAVALHNNASSNTAYGGLMNIYRMEKDDPDYGTFEDTEGKSMARHLQREFLKEFPTLKDRKVQADQGDWVSRNLGFTRWGFSYRSVPVIVEFGFITCPHDQEIIDNNETPTLYVKALVAGLQAYLKEANNG